MDKILEVQPGIYLRLNLISAVTQQGKQTEIICGGFKHMINRDIKDVVLDVGDTLDEEFC